jgi:hypothetical protein
MERGPAGGATELAKAAYLPNSIKTTIMAFFAIPPPSKRTTLMTLREFLTQCGGTYDALTYAPQVYEELVVQGKEHPGKFLIMGAWKTGCLRKDPQGTAYTDEQGNWYGYTKRWAGHTPVGHSTWACINKQQSALKSLVPPSFPATKPEVLQDLQRKQGFGFIWGLFALHCFYPKVYPLYDQHVYRAYKMFLLGGDRGYPTAPDNWQAYSQYRAFFLAAVQEFNTSYWLLDRELWASGKALKVPRKQAKKENMEERDKNLTSADGPDRTDWRLEYTLGGKAKPFWWKIDKDYKLSIARKFKNEIHWRINELEISDIENIQKYMEPEKLIHLANSVEKLKNGTEKEGLGKFIYHQLRPGNETFAQLASHLVALFYQAEIWEWNEKQRNMQCARIPDADWQQALTDRYNN